eukprot:6507968-Alexandrium_andersonii.AAC.1
MCIRDRVPLLPCAEPRGRDLRRCTGVRGLFFPRAWRCGRAGFPARCGPGSPTSHGACGFPFSREQSRVAGISGA